MRQDAWWSHEGCAWKVNLGSCGGGEHEEKLGEHEGKWEGNKVGERTAESEGNADREGTREGDRVSEGSLSSVKPADPDPLFYSVEPT